MQSSLFNRPARNARRGLVIAALGACMLALPPLIHLNGMDGGYALQTIGAFIVLVGGVTWAVYRSLSQRFERILRGEGLLAHWVYSAQEWSDYTQAEFAERNSAFGGLLSLILFIAAVVCLALAMALGDDAVPIMLGVWVGLAVLLTITRFVASHQGLWRNRRAQGEAVISQLGVLLPAEEHFWGILGARITGARLEKSDGSGATLRVQYEAPVSFRYESYEAHVRVPDGAEDSARKVAAALQKAAHRNEISEA